jgi:hypothetical protein
MDVYSIAGIIPMRLILLIGDSMTLYERRSSSFIGG